MSHLYKYLFYFRLLVLDEIDQLDSKNQKVLYTIFEWPLKPDNKIVLIGIANALDFTDRTLPRLQSHLTIKPKLMYFAPYTKQQIIEIFNERLKSSCVADVFPPAALQMLAAKVSAVSGDVRRALDISRRAIELAEQTKTNNILKPKNENHQEVPKTVELKQVVAVLNAVFGTSQNLNEEVEDSFPLQQKLLLCSLILMLKKGKNRDILVGKLHEVYRKVCKKRNIQAVDQSEFVGLCSLIETRGILRVHGKKAPQLNKVCLEWDEDEVSDVLSDKRLLSSVLEDVSVLGK